LSEAVFVCLGCGPVGLCAILTACSKGVGTIYAVDSVDDRLAEAKSMGAIPLKIGSDDIRGVVMGATQGRGADAVIEVVGNLTALRSAFDLLRPCGVLSSIGFHQGDFPFTALESYQKNLK
jgi:threonine dehydrogenase-like Zn-dependent dehydrogenase